ncbi:MAG TPA: hypothetical protein VMT15_02475 [Bryobacteraceae bacterium]|nr:hypothetical protein [Bryobacteraceae bacterium]
MEQGVTYLTSGLALAVLWRLWSARLAPIYKLLFFYLTADTVLTVGGLSIQPNTNWYAYYYIGAQTVKILIAAFVLVEIYSLSLANTPALAQFVRNCVAYILAASALFPGVALVLDRSPARYPLLRGFFLFEQTMGAIMAIFLVLLSIFLAYFPVRLRRNVFVYSSGFIVWAVTHSVAVFLVNHSPGDNRFRATVNLSQAFIQAGCLLFWLAGLQQEGELRTAVVGHIWSRAEADRLTELLEAINSRLERLRRERNRID